MKTTHESRRDSGGNLVEDSGDARGDVDDAQHWPLHVQLLAPRLLQLEFLALKCKIDQHEMVVLHFHIIKDSSISS